MNLKKLLIASLTGALLLSGCSTGSKTAMTIGDTVITDKAIEFTLEYLMGSDDASAAQEALEQSFLIKEVADKMDITIDDEELQSIKQSIASFKANAGGKTEGDKLLKSYGVDDDFLIAISASSSYVSQIFEQIDLEDPTDDELRQYFKDDYLRAKHVLIMTVDSTTGLDLDDEQLAEAEQKANDILERANNGEDFDALISEYNEDPGMESNADGYFFTDDEMVAEFEEATKSIEPGEFTLCKSSYGYHVIQRLPIDDSDADFDRFFEEHKTSIESSYTYKQQEEALYQKAEELGITVTVNQDVIDAIKLDDTEDTADTETAE